MEEINQSIIEKYLAHELTPAEEKAVEERAKHDYSLKQAFFLSMDF